MLKMFSYFIIVVGSFLIGLGGYQYFKMTEAQENSLAEAHQILNERNSQEKAPPVDAPVSFEPAQGETVGILSIPKIDAELPIIEGTDEDELEKGVGHYKGTAYPMEKDQIVLSGHRDTVFRKMGELDIGDHFIVNVPYGSFTYEIVSTKIVDANDTTIIKSTAPHEELVVTTCYPFTFVGNAPDRYIITAKPVQ